MKKIISFMLSAGMALSVMSPFATTVYALEDAPSENGAAIVSEAKEEIETDSVTVDVTEDGEKAAPVGEQAVEETQVTNETTPVDENDNQESKEEDKAEQAEAPEEGVKQEEAPEEVKEEDAPEEDVNQEKQPETGDSNQEEEEPKQEEETEETVQPEESAIERVAQLFSALPTASAVTDMKAEELAAAMEAMRDAMDAFNALSEEETNSFIENYAELYHAVMEDFAGALAEATDSENSTMSVRPIPQTTDVYLTLTDYTKEQLQAFPVDQILTMLTDSKGEKIEVDTGYTNAWFYFKDEDFDEYHALNSGETIDLWYYLYNYGDYTHIKTDYNIYMVLGKGSQLDDSQNHRYVITVELNTLHWFSEYIYPELFENGQDVYGESFAVEASTVFDAVNMPGEIVNGYYTDYNASNTYAFGLDLDTVESMARNGIKVAVYPMSNFLAYRDNGAELTGEITGEIFSDTGYEADFKTPVTAENIATAPNAWCLVFITQETQSILGYMGFSFTMQEYKQPIYARLWYDKDGTITEGFDSYITARSGKDSYLYFNLDLKKQGNVCTTREKDTGYPSSGGGHSSSLIPNAEEIDFYFTLDGNIERIKTVYQGAYDSEEEALNAGAKDITAEVLYDGTQEMPFGFCGNYAQPKSFTIVYKDGTGLILSYRVYDYVSSSGSSDNKDPYFSIEGANIEETTNYGYTYVNYLSSYSAYNAGGVPLDTYYRRDDKYDVGGYQVLFIRDEIEAENFKNLIPRFWTPDGVEVNSGAKVESGKTNLQNAQWAEAMADTVEYQVHVPGQSVKNYRVTFLTQQQEPTLFVGGPDERFVNLTADNNYVHDVLIANLGKEALTGLKVELIDPVHIKLDEYWTVGGAGNDALPAFDTISRDYIDENGETIDEYYYATLPNITKIRLLADGEGEISGTLRVTAANGQQRDIKLTGIAANPHITSADLDDAVKYVPYSYMVATDNMYNWNRTSFKITEGRLPEGMYLYETTGEIYGAPQEAGEFTFTVEADYSSSRFSPSTATFTLTVKDNTNLNVYNESDEGYSIQVPLGVEQGAETRDFLLQNISTDQLYVSDGVFPEFVGLWLNGKRLVRNADYTAESGSTRITIKSQTFANKCNQSGNNTIAAEFRVDGDRDKELKRTAQNFRLGDVVDPGISDESASGGISGSTPGTPSGNETGSGTSASGSATAHTAAATAVATTASQGVMLRCYLVDEENEALPGMAVELHSTPRSGMTDKNGLVVFSNVEFGAHSLTVKDANGTVLATKNFELASGSAGVTGDQITAMNGSAIAVTVKLKNSSLSFAKVAAVPQTGDSFDPKHWIMLMMISGVCLLGMVSYKKKKAQQR